MFHFVGLKCEIVFSVFGLLSFLLLILFFLAGLTPAMPAIGIFICPPELSKRLFNFAAGAGLSFWGVHVLSFLAIHDILDFFAFPIFSHTLSFYKNFQEIDIAI